MLILKKSNRVVNTSTPTWYNLQVVEIEKGEEEEEDKEEGNP